MKLRQPKKLNLPESVKQDDSGFRRVFTVELITPLYGGGVVAGTPDEDMPIRAAAIRGQLRFWWRVLNPNATFQQEKEIWGGMGGKSEQSGNDKSESKVVASRVVVAVSDLPSKIEMEACAKYERQKDGRLNGPHWQHNIPGYALFPGQGQLNNARTDYKIDDAGNPKKPAKVILPPLKFKLHIEITGVDAKQLWDSQVEPTLHWWASFGGLGARTRRGLGSVKVTGEGLMPVTVAEVTMAGCKLVCLPAATAMTAWVTAIGRLKDFRQGANIGRNPGNGRSRWPEADSIREITNTHLICPTKTHAPVHPARQSFPRAVFGLPIITHFKPAERGCTRREPADTRLKPVNSERMASPLILKAMWADSGYKPIALLLPCDFSNLALEIAGRTLSAGTWWPATAQAAMTSGAVANPLHNQPGKPRTGDVLQDFLNFFEGK